MAELYSQQRLEVEAKQQYLQVADYLDKKGKVKKIEITTIMPAGSGGGALPGDGISQALSASNTVTGYQQTRNSGKLGRVTWHELFKQ